MTIHLAVTAGLWLIGVLAWHGRLRRALRPTPLAVDVLGDSVDVSIIVPARNEEHNLPALLESLATLHPAPREIIVVDDRSEDATARVARDAGATVITATERPEGWNGKPWACTLGAQAATGSLLLFTDADTVHGPTSLGQAVAHLRAEQADMLSVVPTHVVRAGWEALQGVFHLLLLVATRAGANPRRGERRFSIGQYLLFTRGAYDRIGGHEPGRARIAEDLALATAIVESGGKTALVTARDMMRVRMYPTGLRAFVAGWRRNFTEGLSSAGVLGVLEVVAVVGWLLGAPVMLATSAIAGDLGAASIGGAVYALAAVDIARRQRAIGSMPAWSALTYPLFVALFVFVSAAAAFDKLRGVKVTWKGRETVGRAR